jgi:hypothetical protein
VSAMSNLDVELRERIAAALREHEPPHLTTADGIPADEYECCADVVMGVLRDAAPTEIRRSDTWFVRWTNREDMDDPAHWFRANGHRSPVDALIHLDEIKAKYGKSRDFRAQIVHEAVVTTHTVVGGLTGPNGFGDPS